MNKNEMTESNGINDDGVGDMNDVIVDNCSSCNDYQNDIKLNDTFLFN